MVGGGGEGKSEDRGHCGGRRGNLKKGERRG
jgi:hypothetical protein